MSTPTTHPAPSPATGLHALALLVAAAGVAGTLYLSLGMELLPCPLCYYERSFVMAAAAILAVGLLSGANRWGSVAGLALPVAAAGLTVVGLHAYLEAVGKLECPRGVAEVGSAPQQSLACFVLLTLALLAAALPSRLPGGGVVVALLGLAVGAAAGYGCIVSTPKPPPQTKPYDGPPKGCRQPYVSGERGA